MAVTYVFDTSGLIGAWRRWYPPDVFPGLWNEFDALIDAGRAIAPHEVYEELDVQDDELHKWVKARREEFIAPTDRSVMLQARAVLDRHPNLTKAGTGRNRADPFVIALATLRGAAVVTGELGGTLNRPKIPFVCDDLGVGCIGLLELIRSEQWTFKR
jgi:hypothetical protein